MSFYKWLNFNFGFASESKHQPITRDIPQDGSVNVTLAPVLQHHTADSFEDGLTVKEFYLCKDDPVCREFNQNSNLWETKQIEKTHAKENNHTYKTIFMWFGNLPTSTELQGFHYKIRRYNSA